MESIKEKFFVAGFWRVAAIAGFLVLQAESAQGQAEEKYNGRVADTSDWGKWKRNCSDMVNEFGKETFMNCASSAFTSRPFHFLAQSVVPGSAVGGGGRYAPDVNRGRWQNEIVATSVVTIRQFWFAELKFVGERSIRADWNKSGESLGLNIYARNRSLPSMPFYGLGPNTNVNNSVRFSQRDTVAGIEMTSPFPEVSWLSFAGKLEGMWPNVGGVSANNVVSIQQQYTEQTAPGLTTQPPMVHEQISLNPHARLFEPFEIDYKIAYNLYQDTSTGHFSFRRFEANLEHHYYPQRDKRGRARLDSEFLFRWRYSVSDTSAANAVPFYLQETLGGSDIDNQPTLRAFRDYRFRGPNLMMVQVEYDRRLCQECKPCGQGTLRTVCTHLGLLVAYDAGKVALRKSDLDFSGMRQSFGGGFAIYLADRVVFRVAVALGGGEGAHPYFGIADFLQ
jgi:hypothetical protein